MKLSEYLEPVESIVRRPEQQAWFEKLQKVARKGHDLFFQADLNTQNRIWDELNYRVRTEEIKAWYSEPENGSLFQGTSVSSLTIPHIVPEPLQLDDITQLEEYIADAYIAYHHQHVDSVRGAIQENTDEWIGQGLYYGVAICSKVISQAFGFSICDEDVIFEIDGHQVDPHEITSYPQHVRAAYFEKCAEKINCFEGLDLEQQELESSLVLADISKPKISKYKDQIMLAPIRCNEIAAVLSERIVERIKHKSNGEISPHSLAIIIYDTDTPYTYHEIMGYNRKSLAPVLPGLIVLGASGTIDAFRWLYTYRVSLLTQKIQKGSLYSQVQKRFMPFVFYGVLVWRDAEILLDMENLSRLRYRGNISPDLEFAYLTNNLIEQVEKKQDLFDWEKFEKKHIVS